MTSDLLVLLVIRLGYVLAAGALGSAIWALWRMTWAHERIEQHADEIERPMAEHVRRSPS